MKELKEGFRWAAHFFGFAGPRERRRPSIGGIATRTAVGAAGVLIVVLTSRGPIHSAGVFVAVMGIGRGLVEWWRRKRWRGRHDQPT